MLVLSRKENQTIKIGQDVELTVVEVRGGRVRLGLDAPRGVTILRGEISDAQGGAHGDGTAEPR